MQSIANTNQKKVSYIKIKINKKAIDCKPRNGGLHLFAVVALLALALQLGRQALHFSRLPLLSCICASPHPSTASPAMVDFTRKDVLIRHLRHRLSFRRLPV